MNWEYEVQSGKESQSAWRVKASLNERLRLKVQKRIRRTERILSCAQLARTTEYRAAALVSPVGRFEPVKPISRGMEENKIREQAGI